MKTAKTLFHLVLVLIFAACSSTTIVRTNDPKVRIFIDGEYKGKGSVSHSDQKIVGSVTHVTLKKKGCRPQNHNFTRNEEFDAGACLGGVFTLIPFLWIQKYKPEHSYEFECDPVKVVKGKKKRRRRKNK